MMSPSALMKAVVSKLLPSSFNDDRDLDRPVRVGKYGEINGLFAAPTRHQLAEEGSYMTSTNPTISTGFTWVAAQTTFVDTAPNLLLQNLEPQTDRGKNIYFDFLKLIATAIATGTTAIHYAFILDNVLRTPTTDNMLDLVFQCSNPSLPLPAKFLFQVQNNAAASVVPAASTGASFKAARGVLGGLNIAGDEMLVVFGATDAGAQPATTAAEAAGQPGRRASSSSPICVPPGWSLAGHIWMPGSSASFNPEAEFGIFAR